MFKPWLTKCEQIFRMHCRNKFAQNQKTMAAIRNFHFLRCILFISAFFILHVSFASPYFDTEVQGVVTQADNSPLPGATVIVKGSQIQTVTDAKGSFRLTVPEANSTLVISYVGFASQEISINGRTNINVVLLPASAELSTVVVMGYGSQRKRDVTGAVKSVKSEAFNKGIINSPEQLIQGKAAGVNVTSSTGEPGASIGITIRGPGGVRTGSTPLFVIDGLPLDNSGTGGAGNPLSFLNPQDIESMDILKDASATAIYGARGANGVVIITTKKGKAGVSTLTYGTSLGFSKLARKIDVFSADEFRSEVAKINGALVDKGGNTDWQDVITQNAFTQEHNLSMSGGAEKLTYYAAFNMQRQEGIIRNNNLNRYSGRFNVTQKFLDNRLTLQVNLNASHTYNVRPNSPAVIGDAISINPTYPVYDSVGKPARYLDFNNPLITFELEKDITKTNRVIGNISPSFRIAKGLVYKLNFGVDISNAVRDIQSLPSLIPQRDGRLDNFTTSNTNQLIENYLTYDFKVKEHVFSTLAGHSYQKIFLNGKNFSIGRFPITSVEPINNPGIGQELTLATNRPGGYALRNELQSFFGRVNYSFDGRYLLTANFRADGSSKFGSNNKYGFFPSFSAGWVLSEEEFIGTRVFDNLKLRFGWGLTGNQEIPSKITQALYTSSVTGTTSYPLGTGAYPAGTTFSRIANPDIQWEVSNQWNAGLDFAILKGDLSGSVDVFRKTSDNILLEVVPADPVQPAGSVWTNVKDMNIINNGVELELTYAHTTRKGFTYSIGGNTTFMDNIVKNSPYSVIPSGSASGSGLTSATINGYINNQAIGSFYLLDFTGVDANGISTYRDVDGDNIISDKDRIVAGTALPKVIYNFFGSANYKGFDLALNFNGVSGNKIYDNTANSNFYKARLFKGINSTNEALQFPTESVNNAARVSTRYLKNGSYLRLNNLTIGYTLDVNRLGISKWISGARISATGQNLWLLTNYDGFDPEVNTDRQINGILSYGIDYLTYPKAKSFIIGLQVSF
jgi:TonB-linked SusC/RagA family outer membrane protein